ncbi:ricin-type beta-trefoil lectin domain protein [Dactylosporangium sp. CA-092794]|uniref:ricin-type beta-trefoil lectin domain protein n=1 Tax=Dactylosporangium sp. CA-092794 TaxID=3239929 RepID=UPI003D8B2590
MNLPSFVSRIRISRRARIAAATAVVCFAGAYGVTVVMGIGRAGTNPLAGVPVPADQLVTVNDAAKSCPALTGPRVAGQVMEASGFAPSAGTHRGGQGVAGLTDGEWKVWAPWTGAPRDDAKAGIVGLAHYMCDLVGQVRVAGVPGEPWRLGLAAFYSGVTAVQAAGGVPDAAKSYVDKVEGYAAWYALQPQFGGSGATESPTPQQQEQAAPPSASASPSPSPSPSASPSSPPSAAALAASPPAPRKTASPPAMPSGKAVVSAQSGKCLSSTSATDGTALVIWSCDGSIPQQWSFEGDGTVRSVRLCMDLPSASTTDGTPIQVAKCSGNLAQQFRLRGDGTIYSPYANKCLDVWDNRQDDGTPLILWPCKDPAVEDNSNQRWSVR